MTRKTVRFYQLQYVPQDDLGVLAPVEGEFWPRLGDKVAALASRERRKGVRSCELYGEYRTAMQPATSYFYIGKLRTRSEWPDAMNRVTGAIAHLQVADEDAVLVDPTFVVPFGYNNHVAVLALSGSSPRISMLETWFTAMTAENSTIHHYSLTPVLNKRVQEKLAQASGATIFRLKIGPDKQVPDFGGGRIFHAYRNARAVSTETTVELGWSLEQRTGSHDTKATLLEAARFVRDDFVDSATVSLQLQDGDRVKRKQYDLVKEHFTSSQDFDIRDNEAPSELSVLTGINDAIDDFRAEFS